VQALEGRRPTPTPTAGVIDSQGLENIHRPVQGLDGRRIHQANGAPYR